MMYKTLYKAGILLFGVFIILAVVFYKERTILLDNSFFIFEMVRNNGFCIQHSRFIAAFSEFPAFIALKLSAPLKTVAISYSAGYMFVHFACYLLCGIVLKNYKAASGILLTHTILISHNFFWHLSELPTALSFIFVLIALMSATTITPVLRYTILVMIIITLGFAHPLMSAPFFYAMAFMFLHQQRASERKMLVGLAAVFFATIVSQKLFFFDKYEYTTASNLKNFIKLFPNYINIYSNHRFLENIVSLYYWLPVLLTIVVAVYITQRAWLKMMLVMAAFFGFLFLVNISFPTAASPDFYKENLYTVLAMIIALPLVYDVLPLVKHRTPVIVILVMLMATAVYRIYDTRKIYSNRIDEYRKYMAATGDAKILTAMNKEQTPVMIMPWATPYEFWLLSTIEQGKTASIIVHEHPEELSWAMNEPKSMLTTWGMYPYKDLNPVYFKFTDTVNTYRLIK